MGLEAARALVPWWVPTASVAAHAGAAFLGTFGLCALLFRFVRRADGLKVPWPVRAREIYPARAALLVASLAPPGALVLAGPTARGDLLAGKWAVTLCAALASIAAAVHWRRRLARLLGGSGWTLRRALLGMATRALVLYPHLWAMLAAALAMPPRFGLASAAFFAGALFVLFWLARGGGFRIACALGLAPPAPPEIAEELRAAAARAGIALAGVHVIELPEANAYALPFADRIGFTRPALQKIERAHLLAIGQHEVTHLTESARARRTRVAGMLVFAPLLFVKPLAAEGGLTAVLLAVLATLLLARLLQRSLLSLETRADQGARAAEPEQGVYAAALAELYRLNLIPVVFRRTTHPHLYDRLVALGAPPPYPRPKPPSRAAGLLLWGLVVVCSVVLVQWGSLAAALLDGDPWVQVALGGGDARDAGDLASSAHAAGRYGEAATFYRAAAELEPDRPHWPAYQSMSLAAAGRTGEASSALLLAKELAREWPWPCGEILVEAQRRIDAAR